MNEITIAEIRGEAGGVFRDATDLVIASQDDFELAQHFLLGVKALVNKINDTLGPDILKAHELHKSMLATKAGLLEPVVKAEFIVKGKVGQYQKMLEDKRQKEVAKLIKKNIIPPPMENLQVKGVSFADVWKYEITNEALIPREYLMPDESKIGRVARAMKDKTVIPGVKVFSTKCVKASA